LGDTNRFEPLQRTHKTDTATNAESSQELADIYENWADDASGRVINIASVHGLVASPFKSAYVVAKHGVLGFTKALALEEAANGITANAVCPSYIRTALAEEQVTNQAQANDMTKAEALEEILLEPVAIKRLLEPEEVSELVVYLASDLASGITGSAIPIDCGWAAR
jgi:3-hydroxybutyrate dehydrogenase